MHQNFCHDNILTTNSPRTNNPSKNISINTVDIRSINSHSITISDSSSRQYLSRQSFQHHYSYQYSLHPISLQQWFTIDVRGTSSSAIYIPSTNVRNIDIVSSIDVPGTKIQTTIFLTIFLARVVVLTIISTKVNVPYTVLPALVSWTVIPQPEISLAVKFLMSIPLASVFLALESPASISLALLFRTYL